MKSHPTGLGALFASLLAHRQLLWRLAGREFGARFRGSVLGLGWAFAVPLLTAAVYTFVFSAVFQARWGQQPEGAGHFDFALVLLAGLAVHAVFAECVGRAPMLVVSHASYVTKVVFPLEILPFVVVLNALANAAIMLLIVLAGTLLLRGELHATALWLPVVFAPFLLFAAALMFAVSAVGVFLRDIGPLMGLLVTASLFLTPIFYPVEAVPAAMRPVMWLNPLTLVVEQARAVLVFGHAPDLLALGLYAAAAALALWAAFWAFQRLRPGFADVL
jgi:lipopolysaccharide transport system permease protein